MFALDLSMCPRGIMKFQIFLVQVDLKEHLSVTVSGICSWYNFIVFIGKYKNEERLRDSFFQLCKDKIKHVTLIQF